MVDLAKPAMSVGTIGHAGDGKTALLSAITHVLATEPGCAAIPRSIAELDRIPSAPPFGSHPRVFYDSGTLDRAGARGHGRGVPTALAPEREVEAGEHELQMAPLHFAGPLGQHRAIDRDDLRDVGDRVLR